MYGAMAMQKVCLVFFGHDWSPVANFWVDT